MNVKKTITSAPMITWILLLVAILFIQGSQTEGDKHQEEFEQHYKIYSLETPTQLSFAGEAVPMHDFDIKERYDKELLTNVYWQSQTLLMIKRAHRFFPTITTILKRNGIPEDFKYLVVAESGLQNVSSPAGAMGYWQFLEKTGKMYGLEITEEIDERYHIEKSTEAACKYFKESYKEFNNWSLVAASYNMGIDGVRKQLQSQRVNNYYDLYLNTETSRYVLRILAIKEIIEHPDLFGFNILHRHLYTEIPSVKVRVDKTIPDLALFAKSNGANYKLIKILNPWLRKPTLTVAEGKVYFIALPKEKISQTDLMKDVVNDTLLLEKMHLDSMNTN